MVYGQRGIGKLIAGIRASISEPLEEGLPKNLVTRSNFVNPRNAVDFEFWNVVKIRPKKLLFPDFEPVRTFEQKVFGAVATLPFNGSPVNHFDSGYYLTSTQIIDYVNI